MELSKPTYIDPTSSHIINPHQSLCFATSIGSSTRNYTSLTSKMSISAGGTMTSLGPMTISAVALWTGSHDNSNKKPPILPYQSIPSRMQRETASTTSSTGPMQSTQPKSPNTTPVGNTRRTTTHQHQSLTITQTRIQAAPPSSPIGLIPNSIQKWTGLHGSPGSTPTTASPHAHSPTTLMLNPQLQLPTLHSANHSPYTAPPLHKHPIHTLPAPALQRPTPCTILPSTYSSPTIETLTTH